MPISTSVIILPERSIGTTALIATKESGPPYTNHNICAVHTRMGEVKAMRLPQQAILAYMYIIIQEAVTDQDKIRWDHVFSGGLS